ncbi:tryptophan synthase subunit beta [Metamycoplasma hyosynoviae]|uniref:Tryptophan synthase beta chain n=1 Tax=Metamycoplasma hyosynoviae TaxID=29559 RepID=A0AAP4EKL7_9BACT|nr:tryptophan synthase subunit beta [Metamycoplasma hyosynoviae]MDI3048171.1 tryptophan synthase subunit beta [Metamycoplasma hyosynoviae]MDI3102898.1 tryptophan synthase subunit beta [Metamycoplasma hyosynoviae]MDI3118251.1 tryptophan synthase subunit beta [Metamycoplasma hyosynoviae]
MKQIKKDNLLKNIKLEEYLKTTPNAEGYFGEYGGNYLDDEMKIIFQTLANEYAKISQSSFFKEELNAIRKNLQGRPTPIYFCKNLSAKIGKVKIFLKREDLNEGGSHKFNHCIAEALIAKMLGKKKIIAETGAGSHGAAIAAAAAHFGLECEIHMGKIDIEKQRPNVEKMQILGAKIIPVTHGNQTLKEAVDSAFESYKKEYKTAMYCIGSTVGPHPFPKMIRDFQMCIGEESKEQFAAQYNKLPDYVIACVGGGSNSAGSFIPFLFSDTKLIGVEPLGKGSGEGENAATLNFGKDGILHGFKSILLQNQNGEPSPVYSIASGLDYPSVGPEHAYLKKNKLVEYVAIDDADALEAFLMLANSEGIIPAIESSHALAYAIKLAKQHKDKDLDILVTLSGKGDKDLEFLLSEYSKEIKAFRNR